MTAATALYLRISLDDEKQAESDSIANQRDLLQAYAAADPALCAGEILVFADDGWSGTNFDRPQVKELLDLARRGGVQNILVKDLSRWGRNYPQVNEYLDQVFPFLGIRFISINDHYDSNDYKGSTAPMDVAFSSIMHDLYCKELSVKVKQSHMAKALKGEYVCGTEPFGYLRSETQKNRLVIDEGAAETVRRIFGMACAGLSAAKIAAALNAEGVDTALTRRRRTGRSSLGMEPINGRTYWGSTQILRILADERYTGTMVCFKSKKVSPGSKRQINRPESEWVKIPDAHEAIISAEQFAETKAHLPCNKKTPHGVSPNRALFAGKIVCGHCGRVMQQRVCRQSYHFCNGVKLNRGQGCYDGKIFTEKMKEVILVAVGAEAQKILDIQGKRFRQAEKQVISTENTVSEELKNLTAHITALDRRSISLYENFTNGKIDKDSYLSVKAANNEELEKVQARIEELDCQLVTTDVGTNGNAAAETILQRVLHATDVTSEVLSLIDRIIVFDDEHIEIRFAFGDSNVTGIETGA